jgi:hypothetical protein
VRDLLQLGEEDTDAEAPDPSVVRPLGTTAAAPSFVRALPLLLDLPEDVMVSQVLRRLHRCDLGSFSATCKRANELSHGPSLWRDVNLCVGSGDMILSDRTDDFARQVSALLTSQCYRHIQRLSISAEACNDDAFSAAVVMLINACASATTARLRAVQLDIGELCDESCRKVIWTITRRPHANHLRYEIHRTAV